MLSGFPWHRYHDIPRHQRCGRGQAQHAQLGVTVRHRCRQREGQVHAGEFATRGPCPSQAPGLRRRRHDLQPHHHGGGQYHTLTLEVVNRCTSIQRRFLTLTICV